MASPPDRVAWEHRAVTAAGQPSQRRGTAGVIAPPPVIYAQVFCNDNITSDPDTPIRPKGAPRAPDSRATKRREHGRQRAGRAVAAMSRHPERARECAFSDVSERAAAVPSRDLARVQHHCETSVCEMRSSRRGARRRRGRSSSRCDRRLAGRPPTAWVAPPHQLLRQRTDPIEAPAQRPECPAPAWRTPKRRRSRVTQHSSAVTTQPRRSWPCPTGTSARGSRKSHCTSSPGR